MEVGNAMNLFDKEQWITIKEVFYYIVISLLA